MYPQTVASDLPGATRVDAVGQVGQCADLYGPDVFMVLGYCHHYSGPYFAVAELLPRSPPLPRLVSERDRRRVGDLAPAPPEWSDLPTVVGLAEQWMGSIREGDVATFARLEDRVVEDLRLDDPERDEYLVFQSPESVFATFRGADTQPQLEVFVGKAPGRRSARLSKVEESAEAYACFCRKPDCQDRWPIAAGDATNDPRRPYACVHIYEAAGGTSAARWIVRTEIRSGELEEP